MQEYARDLRAAAYRHFEAGEALLEAHRTNVAGYLFGWAAECALKHLMIASGMRMPPSNPRDGNAFYAHFEALKTALSDQASGRLKILLRRFADDPRLMQHWATTMRYSHGKDIDPRWVESWRQSARQLVSVMDS